ncbi:MAG: ribosome biogenesis GTPase Der [Acidobacteria bacterium]|nr:ribosome biogenesis GTPase Der [Acidobacteriota bacterium]MCI0628711.1 ribosome biogenesis GTPase Der [Acidobacteriota bacterium]MCI0718191.1 ribosome biogenesis GTPase Der [Acidobacteriota bacterium]
MKLPAVAVVGRPNVGKSTLFNRICGKHKALVGNEPGMTRDRNVETAEWAGRSFELVDTGGIDPGDDALIPRHIFNQAKTAIQRAAAVLLVVDCRAGVTALDQELAKLLIQSSKPLFLVANKCDNPKLWNEAYEFYELGIDRVFPISAEHGMNIGDLLDEVVQTFPRDNTQSSITNRETKVAIVGKPNVGKSTLLNRIVGEDRSIVSPVPGTTRDVVDSLVVRNGKTYRLLDTAGIRKKSQTLLVAEKLSVIMARRSLERCDVALILIDATEQASSLDATIAGYAHEAGAAVILVVNKWDKIHKDSFTMKEYEDQVRTKIRYLDYAPLIFISAETGQRLPKLFSLIDAVAQARRVRVGTGELNSFLQKVALNKASIPANKQVKVHYMTQVGVAPPVFALFTNKQNKIHFSLERYLVNQIRDRFGFQGTPIVIKQKMERKTG